MPTIHVRLTTILNSASFKVAVLLLLSLGTILFFNLYQRYTIIGPELLQNARFDSNLAEWKHSNQGVSAPAPAVGSVRLHSDVSTNFVHISQIISDVERYPLLRLSYDIKTANVTRGQHDWMTARVVLVSPEPNGDPTHPTTHVLASLHGTHIWEHHEAVFSLAANTTWITVSAQLAQATGTMWIKNLSLLPVMEKEFFHTLRMAATVLWAIVILWVALPIILTAFGDTYRTAVIVLALGIAFGTLMPETLKIGIGSLLPASLGSSELPAIHSDAAQFKFTPLWPSPDIFKAGHFVMFAMLSVAMYSRRPCPASRISMLGYLLLFALVTEVLQLLVAGRSAQLGDLIIDGTGIATGLMLLWAVRVFSPHTRD